MPLESLPNEILLDLFLYFDGTDLLRAFYGLNQRFNLLLYKQFRSYSFWLSAISKRDFDILCQQHLPLTANQVIALHLTNYNETPQQIALFCSYIPSIRIFTSLRSLSISSLDAYQLLLQLLDECQHLPKLTHLKFYSCSFHDSQVDFQNIIDTIWRLPKLAICYLDDLMQGGERFRIPTVVSSSIQSLTMYSSNLQRNQLDQLFKNTPHLKYLSTSVKFFSGISSTESAPTMLTKCELRFYDEYSATKLDLVFQTMPNLLHLCITIWDKLIDGYEWEQLVRNYFPKLKTLRLRMKKDLNSGLDIQEKINELINTFRTPFWIDEHKWFIRCFTEQTTIHISTLLNKPHFSHNIFPDSWQSTCPNDDLQEFYKHRTGIFDSTCFNQIISPDIRFPDLINLHIQMPINSRFWSIVPNLNQLMTLSISRYADIHQSQLQTLLDRAPRINKLSVSQDLLLPTQLSFLNCKSSSVRQLDLQESNYCFNEEECQLLTHSSLATQCKVLSICVNSRESIINVIKNMHKLRLLIVQCKDDRYQKGLLSNEQNDEVIQWLKEHLSSSHVIVRDSYKDSIISIWM